MCANIIQSNVITCRTKRPTLLKGKQLVGLFGFTIISELVHVQNISQLHIWLDSRAHKKYWLSMNFRILLFICMKVFWRTLLCCLVLFCFVLLVWVRVCVCLVLFCLVRKSDGIHLILCTERVFKETQVLLLHKYWPEHWFWFSCIY